MHQIDGVIHGRLGGFEARIIIEAKLHRRRVGVGTVDAFVGLLLDLGDDRGVLVSAGGFTAARIVARSLRAIRGSC